MGKHNKLSYFNKDILKLLYSQFIPMKWQYSVTFALLNGAAITAGIAWRIPLYSAVGY